MSAQVALMAGTAALSAFSSIAGGNAQGSALDAKAGEARLQGMSNAVEIAETRAQTNYEELQRRKGLAQLMAANRADLAGRNLSGEQGSSFDVIADHNTDEGNRDIGNIRFMGESKVRRLSFAREGANYMAGQYTSMAGMARTSGWINAGMSIAKMGLSYFGMPSFGMGGGGIGGGGFSPGDGSARGGV